MSRNNSFTLVIIKVKFRTLVFGLIFSFLSLFTIQSASAALFVFNSHTFTNCSATGANGPTQAACRSAYVTDWDESDASFTVVSGIQYWTVPATGSYQIVAAGAQGGNSGANLGGKGVVETSTVSLTEGQIIRILVGQKGGSSDGSHGSGGGGTFVIQSPFNTNASIIMIAGGGGGYGASGGGTYMQGQVANNPTSASGNAGSNGGGGASAANTSGGGNGFVAGANASGSTWAAGGAGFGGNGGAYSAGSIAGPKSFINGGTGGPGTTSSGAGGFGGGGGAGDRGAGGGGYSGGGGGNLNTVGGDGGGSYITGTNQSSAGGTNSGDGYVKISSLTIITANFNSYSLAGSATSASFRTSVTINASVDVSSKVTFKAGNVVISGCKNVLATGSGSTFTATCMWKPSKRGNVILTATAIPTAGGNSGTAIPINVAVVNRVGSR